MRHVLSIPIAVAVVSCLVAPAHAQDAPSPAAEARLQHLARRLATPETSLGSATSVAVSPPPQTPPPAAGIERTPLGPPASEAQPLPANTENDSSWLLDTLTALGIVIALILLLRWGWSRWTGRPLITAAASPVVEVLSRTSVAARNHVVLLRVGGRILIASDSPAGLRTLASVDDPDEVADLLAAVTASRTASAGGNFRAVLDRLNGTAASKSDAPDFADLDVEGGDDDEHRLDTARASIAGVLGRVRSLTAKGGAA